MGTSNSALVLPKIESRSNLSMFYLNRTEKFVLHITESKTQKYRFKSSVKLYSDSAIGYLNDDQVLVVGGTNSKGFLKSDGFLIDFKKMTIEKISPIPMPCKLGSLILYNNFLYYVGSVTNNIEVDAEGTLVGSPIMRYNVNENS